MAKLPSTQEEARGVIAGQIKDTIDAYNAAKRAGDEVQAKQLLQQYKDLNNQFEAAKAGTVGSVGRGIVSGLFKGGEFLGQGAKFAAPILTMPSRLMQAATERKYGKPVTEPQSQEQLVPFRVGEFVGQAAYPAGGGAKGLLTSGAITAADIAAETQGAAQGTVAGGVLAAMMGKAGFKGIRNWNEGRKFEKLLSNLPEDMPELEKNALKRFMLTGQGSDNGIVAAAMQKLETNPQFAEMLNKLRQGATEQTLAGMRPEAGKLTQEQAATGLTQTIKNKLDGLRETVNTSVFGPKSTSLYEKAKGYGGDRGIVDPTNTVKNIEDLIEQYSAKDSDSAKRAVQVLEGMKEKLLAQRMVDPSQSAILAAGGIPETTNKLTVSKVQGMLSEWGKKASAGDSILKDLAVSDEQKISAAIFGGLKDDIRASIGSSVDAKDKAALRLLDEARERTSVASTKYNDAIAQGLPAFLKDKNPASLNFDTLMGEYQKLDSKQRAVVRQWVGDTDPEILKQFDRGVYTQFLDKARDSQGLVDIGKLSELWNTTPVKDRGVLIDALGVNAGEFNARMRDATAFSNRLRVAQAQEEKSLLGKVAPDVARAAGFTVGYGAHQGVMLGADIAEQLLSKSKLTDEQFMKAFLTPEGASFLKESKLTPGSAKILEKITKTPEPAIKPVTAAQQLGSQVTTPEQQPIVSFNPSSVVIPDMGEDNQQQDIKVVTPLEQQ